MLTKILLGLGFLFVYYTPAIALSAFLEGTGVTITHGKSAAPTLRCHDDPNRPSNDCPGQITVVLPPMEPAPDGATCNRGWVLSTDRTHCVESTTAAQ